MLADVIDTKALWETVVAAVIAGLGVTFAFAMAILGAARFVDLRGEDRRLAAGAFAMLAVVSFMVVIGAIVFGIVVMTSK